MSRLEQLENFVKEIESIMNLEVSYDHILALIESELNKLKKDQLRGGNES